MQGLRIAYFLLLLVSQGVALSAEVFLHHGFGRRYFKLPVAGVALYAPLLFTSGYTDGAHDLAPLALLYYPILALLAWHRLTRPYSRWPDGVAQALRLSRHPVAHKPVLP